MDILVTGGLGFIGSHTAVCLQQSGFRPILVDNLSNSSLSVLEGIEKITGVTPVFLQGDVNDAAFLNGVFSQFQIRAVIHFAAFKAVGESVEKPLAYYQNNVGSLITLLQCMEKYSVRDLVFSSSCTVYGEPDTVPVTEIERIKPASSPYGATKQMCETILSDVAWCRSQCLRYFNPVGAHPSAEIGELPRGIPNNLVPFITQAAAGLRAELTVFGNDYPTPDGTNIRDYIHIMDLAEAHLASLNRLISQPTVDAVEYYNLGTGKGCSVLEVIASFEKVNQTKVPYKIGPRRAGDVVQVWADSSKAKQMLGWEAKRGLDEMMKDAWNWQLHLKNSADS